MIKSIIIFGAKLQINFGTKSKIKNQVEDQIRDSIWYRIIEIKILEVYSSKKYIRYIGVEQIERDNIN